MYSSSESKLLKHLIIQIVSIREIDITYDTIYLKMDKDFEIDIKK